MDGMTLFFCKYLNTFLLLKVYDLVVWFCLPVKILSYSEQNINNSQMSPNVESNYGVLFDMFPKCLNRRAVKKEMLNVIYYIITIRTHLIISHFPLAK